jgi:hypothetical protein
LRRGPAQDPKLLVEDLETGNQEFCINVSRDQIGDAVLKEMTRQVRLEADRKQASPTSSPKSPDRKSRAQKKEMEKTFTSVVDDAPLSAKDGICTEKIIIVELTSPTSPNLDISDVPGLVAARSRGRPEDVVSTTANLVKRYA